MKPKRRIDMLATYQLTTWILALLLASACFTGLAAAQALPEPPTVDAVTTLTHMFRWTGLIASIFVAIGAWVLLKFLDRAVEQLGTVFADQRLTLQKFSAFFRFGIYFATITTAILLSLEISREVLTILGGTAAVAVGFAMKDLLASLVAGVMIMFDRPFQLGDRVSFAGQYGDIINVGLRSVKLRTLDDSMVTIPNNMFLNEITSSGNYGVLNMQIMVDFVIGIDQDAHRAREIVREAGVTSNYVYLPQPVEVIVSQITLDSLVALRLRLKAYVLDTNLEKAMETDVTLRVMDAFREEGIRPPAILHRKVPPPGSRDDQALALASA
jgi:small-conductance mechanosensitive channel